MNNLVGNILRDIKLIKKIENNFQEELFLVDNLNIWPVIRLELFKKQDGDNKEINKKKVRKNIKINFLSIIFNLLSNFFKNKKIIKKIKDKKNDEIFFSNKNFYYEKYRNKYINNLIDPYFYFIGKNKLKIEIVGGDFKDLKKKYFEPNYINLISLNPLFYVFYRINFIKKLFYYFYLNSKIKIIENKYKCKIDKKSVLETILKIKLQSELFYVLLKKIRPRIIYLSCYYSLENFSLILASKKLGIKTVDIQHGGMGKFHYMYSNWKHQNLKKNNLLPEEYLIWDKKLLDQNTLPNHKSKNYKVSKKLSIDFWLKNKKYTKEYVEKKNKVFFKNLKKFKKIFLFCGSIDVPKELIKIINKMPNNYFWLIRMHPRHSDIKNNNKLYKSILNEKNYDTDFATKSNLNYLIKISDVFLTDYSSTLYDASYFKKPAVVFNSNKKLFFSQYKSKNLLFTKNINNIIKYLCNKKN